MNRQLLMSHQRWQNLRYWIVGLAALAVCLGAIGRSGKTSSRGAPGTSLSPQQTMGPCRCPDLRDLFNRKGELEAAIATLAREAEIVRGQKATDKSPAAYDDAKDSHLLRDDIQKVIDELHDPAIKNRMKNMTFPTDCESSVQGYTNCLHDAAKAGEAVYQQYCQSRKTTTGEIVAVATGKTWQEQTGLAKLLDVARDSYEAELKFINAELDRLKPLCKTKGWTGQVVVTWTDKDHGSTVGTGATPITRTFDNEDRRDVTIHVFDGLAYGEVSAAVNDKTTAKGGGEAKCGKYKTVQIKVDTTQTIEKHGDFYHRAFFSANIDTRGVVTIQVSINGGEAVGTSSLQDNGSGDCNVPPSPHPSWTKFLPTETLPGVTLTGHSKANPNTLVLEGIDLPLNQQMILGSRTRVVKIEWHLTRLR